MWPISSILGIMFCVYLTNELAKTNLHQVIDKAPEINELILGGIKNSVLFKNCGEDDLKMLVEAFQPFTCKEGDQIITQVCTGVRSIGGASV